MSNHVWSEATCVVLSSPYQRHSLGRDTLATTREAKMFSCGSLYPHTVDINPKVGGNISTHRIDIRPHLRCLCYDGHINIDRPVTLAGEQRHNMPQQHPRVSTAPALIRIRKMETDITQRRSSEQRIAQRMEGDIRIAMP